MNRIIIQYVTLFVLLASGLFAVANPGDDIRKKYNFNSAWKLLDGDAEGAQQPLYDDSKWEDITLPHAFNEDDAFRVAIHEHRTGVVWYRKHFKLPEQAAGKKVFLEFEGIRQAGEFYLNGKFIGRFENGIMAFGIDISDLVQTDRGENVIAVRIDNAWDYQEKSTGSRFQWADKNFNANYGGISKNVFLRITGKLYQTLPLFSGLKTTGVYIHAGDFDIRQRTATIHAESEVHNESGQTQTFTYETEVVDADGKIIGTFRGKPTQLNSGR